MTQTTERPVDRHTSDEPSPARRRGLVAGAVVASVVVALHAMMLSFQLSNDEEASYYSDVAGVLGTPAVWSLIVLGLTAVVAAVRKRPRMTVVVARAVLVVLAAVEVYAILKLSVLLPAFD